MKTLFFEARKKFSDIDYSPLADVKYRKIGLLATVQYINTIYSVKAELIKRGKEVFMSKALKHECQILGCNVDAALKIKDKVDAFLIIGSGRFHAYNVASLGKPVIIWRPGSRIIEFPKEEIFKIKAREKANLSRFLLAESVGIIVSTKPGQCRLADALQLEKKLKAKGKKSFIFISDMISGNELENFRVSVWINTACPHLTLDIPNLLNIDSIASL